MAWNGVRFPTLRATSLSFTLVYKVNLSHVVAKVTVLRTLTEQCGSGHEPNIIWGNMYNSLQRRSGLIGCSSLPARRNHLTSFWQNVKTLFCFPLSTTDKNGSGINFVCTILCIFFSRSVCRVEFPFYFERRLSASRTHPLFFSTFKWSQVVAVNLKRHYF